MSLQKEMDQDEFKVGVKVRITNYNLDRAIKLGSDRTGLRRPEFCRDVLGVSAHYVREYIAFRRFPTEEHICKIAIALGVTTDSIFPDEISGIRLEKAAEVIPISMLPVNSEPFDEALDSDSNLDRIGLPGMIEELLETLTDREAQIIRLRFGFLDRKKNADSSYGALTLEETAREIGVTRGRIQQIEAKALRKLRHPARSRQLLGFINPPRDFTGASCSDESCGRPIIIIDGRAAKWCQYHVDDHDDPFASPRRRIFGRDEDEAVDQVQTISRPPIIDRSVAAHLDFLDLWDDQNRYRAVWQDYKSAATVPATPPLTECRDEGRKTTGDYHDGFVEVRVLRGTEHWLVPQPKAIATGYIQNPYVCPGGSQCRCFGPAS